MKKNEVKKNNKGFSLVELIVVIAIMAVLVGVLAPQFIKYVEKSRISTDIQNVDQIKTALETYFIENDITGEKKLFSDDVNTNTSTKPSINTDSDIQNAMSSAGLKTDKVTFKSKRWSGVNVIVSGGAVTVKGTATYGKTYNLDGSEPTS